MGAKQRQSEETIHGDLSCLSLPVRTRLLRLLERAELGVGELAEILRLPQPTVSNHLRQLMDRQWVERRREGNARLYQLSTKRSKRSRKRMMTTIYTARGRTRRRSRTRSRASRAACGRRGSARLFAAMA